MAGAVIYLSGALHKSFRLDDALMPVGLGIMTSPDIGGVKCHLHKAAAWAADNGCFNRGAEFDADAWLRWLEDMPRVGCLFAVAPDVVGDAEATYARSLPYLRQIRELDFPAAYVAQDGFWSNPIPWDEFDVLFIGGSDTFKESDDARKAITEAKRRGKWVHMGRVNSYRRLSLAAWWGCDSADGTFLAFGPDVNLPRMEHWLTRLSHSPFLEAS